MRLAARWRGSRNNGTPLAMASTPVRALHPAAKAFEHERTPTASRPRVATTTWPGCGRARGQGMDEPHRDDGQQRPR